MNWRVGLAIVVTALALGVGLLAFVIFRGDLGSSSYRSRLDWGSAGTILGGTTGFTVRVTALQPDVLVDGHDYTVLDVVFANTSDSQQRADPVDFTLTNNAGDTRQPIVDGHGACAPWPRTDLYPHGGQGQPLRDSGAGSAGQNFGPVTLCFPSEAATGRLTLIWDPDVSMPFIDSPTRIPLQ
jgi:hypothetical protein